MAKRKKIKTITIGRKKIQYWHDNFEYYQPNTHDCGDCAIRSVSKALNIDWLDSFNILCQSAIEFQEPTESCDNITNALKPYGFSWTPIKPKKGESRPTVSEFASEHRGTYILRVSGHVVRAKDNKYYDIWDSGDKSLYGYWVKDNN